MTLQTTSHDSTPVQAAPVRSHYAHWIAASERAGSSQISFGTWWKMDGISWRVSWLVDTGELYATELKPSDRFILLGHFAARREINQIMQRWFGGNDLRGLVQHLWQVAHPAEREADLR